ncbi:MAG: hypothetical protein U1F49_04205 [Rubrivivax sp.]
MPPALAELQAQAQVPLDQLRRQRRRAAAGVENRIEAEPRVSTFLAMMRLRIGIFSSRLELGRRHLREHALLELQPQPRHRDEQRRARLGYFTSSTNDW